MELRPYQREALEAVDRFEAQGVRRQLIVLPTGTGKTVVFSHINRFPLLVLAHREELLEQAKTKIELANPGLSVAIEQAERRAGKADVVVASVPTLGRDGSKRLGEYDRNYFRCVVIDEAHHAAAPSYGRILDYFADALHVGVTATPQRADNTRLTDRFDEIVYFKTIKEMTEDGWLSPLHGYRLRSDSDLSSVSVRNGEYAEGELSEAVNTPERNALIVDAFQRLCNDKRTIVFCVDIAHATAVAQAFTRHGIPCGMVSGVTPKDERRKILAAFHRGEIKVLTNCMVLTEGFDEPFVGNIIMARPLRSTLLYTQMVGRGTRLAEDKMYCNIIDIADATRNKVPVGLPTLMGMPPDFDLDGADLVEAAAAWTTLEAKSPSSLVDVRSLEAIDDAWEKIDLFTPPQPDPVLLEYYNFIWLETSPGKFFLGLDTTESLELTTDALGRARVLLHSNATNSLVGTGGDLREGFSVADSWVRQNRQKQVVLVDVNAEWRKAPPTEKQIKFLKGKGIPYEHLSKGEASQIIDKWMQENPRPAWLQKKIDQNKGNKFKF